MKKTLYYILNLTWGLILTLIGFLVALFLMIFKRMKPSKYGPCWHFEFGRYWGGVNLGLVFLTQKDADKYTKDHEFGHSIQNAIFGPFTLILVCIPSVVRYHYRSIKERCGGKLKTGYYDIWFEKQASELGEKYIDRYS